MCRLVFLMLILLIIGCGNNDEEDNMAYLEINIELNTEAESANINRIILTVSGPNMLTEEFELNVKGNVAKGTISIPSGKDRKFIVTAYSSSGVEAKVEKIIDLKTGNATILLEMKLEGNKLEQKPDTPINNDNKGNIKDNAPMVLIPAGEFQMGSNDGEDDEKPVHTVYLDAFYMDVYEVTNAQYKKFTDATGRASGFWDDPDLNAPNNPIAGVYWNDAKAYADWAVKRLPTEAEWEKSARGGLVGKKYPWGDDISHDNANYSGVERKDQWIKAAPVGSFTPNGYGLYDMAGNVSEWCADWYDRNYYANSSAQNPIGPTSGSYRVYRGGSWHYADNDLRVAHRHSSEPTSFGPSLGFRCAMDVPK